MRPSIRLLRAESHNILTDPITWVSLRSGPIDGDVLPEPPQPRPDPIVDRRLPYKVL